MSHLFTSESGCVAVETLVTTNFEAVGAAPTLAGLVPSARAAS